MELPTAPGVYILHEPHNKPPRIYALNAKGRWYDYVGVYTLRNLSRETLLRDLDGRELWTLFLTAESQPTPKIPSNMIVELRTRALNKAIEVWDSDHRTSVVAKADEFYKYLTEGVINAE